MQQNSQPEEHGMDLYALPLVGGALAGYLVARWIDTSGLLGVTIGVFAADALRGLSGTYRLAGEIEYVVHRAHALWTKNRVARLREETSDAPASAAPASDEASSASMVPPS